MLIAAAASAAAELKRNEGKSGVHSLDSINSDYEKSSHCNLTCNNKMCLWFDTDYFYVCVDEEEVPKEPITLDGNIFSWS